MESVMLNLPCFYSSPEWTNAGSSCDVSHVLPIFAATKGWGKVFAIINYTSKFHQNLRSSPFNLRTIITLANESAALTVSALLGWISTRFWHLFSFGYWRWVTHRQSRFHFFLKELDWRLRSHFSNTSHQGNSSLFYRGGYVHKGMSEQEYNAPKPLPPCWHET